MGGRSFLEDSLLNLINCFLIWMKDSLDVSSPVLVASEQWISLDWQFCFLSLLKHLPQIQWLKTTQICFSVVGQKSGLGLWQKSRSWQGWVPSWNFRRKLISVLFPTFRGACSPLPPFSEPASWHLPDPPQSRVSFSDHYLRDSLLLRTCVHGLGPLCNPG